MNESMEHTGISQEGEKRDFKDFITLNTNMTPQEALQLLYQYYPETRAGTFENDFPDLASAKEQVRFEISTLQIHGGNVKLSGKMPNGTPWYYLLSSRNGLKQAKIG